MMTSDNKRNMHQNDINQNNIQPNTIQSNLDNANVDWQEIAKFAEAKVDWWDKNGPMRALHHINPLRLQYISDRVNINNLRILDLGCGGGILAESLAKAGGIVTGIDLNETAISAAQAHQQLIAPEYPHLNLAYQVIDSASLAGLQPASYDLITCMELLEHVPQPEQIILDCARLLRPGGYLFMSTLNRNWLSYCAAILVGEYLLKLLPPGTHDFAKFIKPAELHSWAQAAGFTINNFAGVHYNILNHSCKLTNNLRINYLAAATLTSAAR